jgi:hypothetical protein
MKAILVNGSLKYESQYKVIYSIDGVKTYTVGATEQQWLDWGFKEVVIPTITPLQKLGGYFETETEITMEVIDLVLDINEIYDGKMAELASTSDRYRDYLMKSSYEDVLRGTVSPELLALVEKLETIKLRITQALDSYLVANDILAMKTFSFSTDEAKALEQEILNFK